MELNDIFYSIQGEGLNQGLPTIFIRTAKCNLACRFCDTQFQKVNHTLTPKELLEEVRKYPCSRICLTGGEPLLEPELPEFLKLLAEDECHISIETNGSLDIKPFMDYEIVMDIKCPSSGMAAMMKYDNLYHLKFSDQVKFVVGDKEDYEYVKFIMGKYPIDAQIILSPCWQGFSSNGLGKDIARWILSDGLNRIRLQLQEHKLLSLK
jgi:7-carboxy-7-deazaguanine synthase